MCSKILKITGVIVRNGVSLRDFTFRINSMPLEQEAPVRVDWYESNILEISFMGIETERCELTAIPHDSLSWEEKG